MRYIAPTYFLYFLQSKESILIIDYFLRLPHLGLLVTDGTADLSLHKTVRNTILSGRVTVMVLHIKL